MKKFTTLKSIPVYLPIANIDTDTIIPAQFLKTIKRTGLGKHLFFAMRYDESGNLINDFKLIISNKKLGKDGDGNIKKYFRLFLHNKKNTIEKVNLFGEKLTTYKLK